MIIHDSEYNTHNIYTRTGIDELTVWISSMEVQDTNPPWPDEFHRDVFDDFLDRESDSCTKTSIVDTLICTTAWCHSLLRAMSFLWLLWQTLPHRFPGAPWKIRRWILLEQHRDDDHEILLETSTRVQRSRDPDTLWSNFWGSTTIKVRCRVELQESWSRTTRSFDKDDIIGWIRSNRTFWLDAVLRSSMNSVFPWLIFTTVRRRIGKHVFYLKSDVSRNGTAQWT